MTIEEHIHSMEQAAVRYQDATNARTKRARYTWLLATCAALSDRLHEAVAWMDAAWSDDDELADVWITVLHRYERGCDALEGAKAWL